MKNQKSVQVTEVYHRTDEKDQVRLVGTTSNPEGRVVVEAGKGFVLAKKVSARRRAGSDALPAMIFEKK